MSHPGVLTAARCLLTVLVSGQGLATAAIDLNRTHATNPTWPGHARFHLVWQTATQLLLALATVALIWWSGNSTTHFYIAAAFTAVPLCGFFLAFVGRRLFHGTLQDPGGIPPAVLKLAGKEIHIDGNLAAVCFALPLLAAIVLLFAYGQR